MEAIVDYALYINFSIKLVREFIAIGTHKANRLTEGALGRSQLGEKDPLAGVATGQSQLL